MAEAAKNSLSVLTMPTPGHAPEVAELLSLVVMAPSARNLQPWRFVVVTDPETKEVLRGRSVRSAAGSQGPLLVGLYTDMVEALSARVDQSPHPHDGRGEAATRDDSPAPAGP